MNELLHALITLQSLEFEETTEAAAKTTIAELRAKIPSQILGHYDRLAAQGKKGVTVVRGRVCSGCHMQVPLAIILTLKRGDDIQLCECCGRYLYLPPDAEIEPMEPVAAPKAKKKTRKTRKSLQAV